MPDNILEILRDYRPPKKLHPIAGKAFDAYLASGNELTEETQNELRAELKGYGEDLKGLTDALCGLAAVMIYVSENLDDPDTGEKVAEIIKETGPRYEPLTQRAVRAIEELKRLGKETFDRFVGAEPEGAKAPKFGESAPDGSVPLRELKPVAEPPLWAKKKKGKKK